MVGINLKVLVVEVIIIIVMVRDGFDVNLRAAIFMRVEQVINHAMFRNIVRDLILVVPYGGVPNLDMLLFVVVTNRIDPRSNYSEKVAIRSVADIEIMKQNYKKQISKMMEVNDP